MPSRRGARSFLFASAAAQVFALIRYTILARLIGPEQLGLAATLILTQQFLESFSDSGSDRFLVQDSRGDTPQAQSLVQLVFLGRGLMTATALILFSGPLAGFYHAPQLVLGLVFLAISPLIFGFLHLDIRRLQRHNDFRAEGSAMLVAESLSLVVTVIAAFAMRSYVAVLYGLIARSLAMVIVSHWRSERRYSIGFSRRDAPQLARFAAPLMFNGILLFVGSQGDRIVIANQLGITALGHYSAVQLLVYYPANVVIRYLVNMHMPRVAAAQGGGTALDQAVETLGGQCLTLAVAMVAGFALVAPRMVVILYGARFTQPPFLIALIGILITSRLIRVWPTVFALGTGASRNVLMGNVVRLIALPAAIGGGVVVGGLAGILSGFMLGEALAFCLAMTLLNRQTGYSLLRGFDRLAIFVLTSAVVLGWTFYIEHPNLIVGAGLVAGSIFATVWLVWREIATLQQACAILRKIVLRRTASPT